MKQVRCNKCGYTADEDEFPKGRDFLQNRYISGCPKCDNRQTPGGASMRGFGGERPFSYVRAEVASTDPLDVVLHRTGEAS